MFDSNDCLLLPIFIPVGALSILSSPVYNLWRMVSAAFVNDGSILCPVLADASRNYMPFSLAKLRPYS